MRNLPALRQPSCYSCEHNYTYENAVPQKRNGVMMHFMERFCLKNKRARKYRKGDPTSKVPDWCPKFVTPSTVRVFGFRDTENWLMHQSLCRALGKELAPEAHRYAVEKTAALEMRAHEVHKLMMNGTELDKLLQMPIALHYVVEISDGVQSACYYKTTDGYRYEPFFNVKTALENRMEREDGDAA